MAITDKTRKILWGKAASRCAYCHCELVMEATEHDPAAIIGSECHIIGRSLGGPRHDPNYAGDIDSYDNLLLLCNVHHTMVDSQPNTYSIEILRKLKFHHETWVQKSLQSKKKTSKTEVLLPKITSGKEIVDILLGADARATKYDEPKTREELDSIKSFLQKIEDWGDWVHMVEQSETLEASFELNQDINKLEEAGFYIFGGLKKSPLESTNSLGEKIVINDWNVAFFVLAKNDNPEIRTIS